MSNDATSEGIQQHIHTPVLMEEAGYPIVRDGAYTSLSEQPFNDPVQLRRNFLKASLTFSITHACVTVVLSYSTAELGDAVSSIGGGVLYVVYSLSSLFLGKIVCNSRGAKGALCLGLVLYSIYVISFLLSIAIPAIKWPVFILGSFCGGIAAGILWTAQGLYYQLNSRLACSAAGGTNWRQSAPCSRRRGSHQTA